MEGTREDKLNSLNDKKNMFARLEQINRDLDSQLAELTNEEQVK